jgi:hypothetical protein
MRLWTVHPKYLDAKGLVAAWREALLAQKVLAGQTKGYRKHPQLTRFQTHRKPVAAIAAFLSALADEAERREYHFDRSKILLKKSHVKIRETSGQLIYEWQHLKRKLEKRAPKIHAGFAEIDSPEPHPIFQIVAGEIREWEKTGSL